MCLCSGLAVLALPENWLEMQILGPYLRFIKSEILGGRTQQQIVLICFIKACILKAMVLPVVMYRCESWTIKKGECQTVNGFKLRCWRRLLRIP